MDVGLPPLCRRSGPDLSTSFVGSLGDALRRSSLPPLLPRREPSEPAALQTSSASRETPPRAVDAHVIGATTTPSAPAAAKDITPWRFVGMVGNTLLSPPIPSGKGADPHRDDLIRMPDRGRCPITRSDQETMGSPDDLLVPSPQVRPMIEHPVPHLGRRRRSPIMWAWCWKFVRASGHEEGSAQRRTPCCPASSSSRGRDLNP